MTDRRAQHLAFAGSSILTDLFPTSGARLLDATVLPIAGSKTLSAAFGRYNRREMAKVKSFRRFLVIPDIHIGDAVMAQSSLSALRDFFPDAEIDYAVNRNVAPIIEGNPDASRVLPLFSSAQLSSPADLGALRELTQSGRYDLCLSFSTLLQRHDFAAPDQPFINFLTHSAEILRTHRRVSEINHFSYQFHHFVHGLLGPLVNPVREPTFAGVRTTYSDEAIISARTFAIEAGISLDTPVVMFNPDAACRFTLLPFDDQAALISQIAHDTPDETKILVGAGHTWDGIGERLRSKVPEEFRAKILVIPKSLPLDVYAALIDFADIFITGDTGPLHLATARRYSRSGAHAFRNRTAVLSIFGATIPRMSGYDSNEPGFFAGNQDAPSWCYQSGSSCHNITCLNKYFKTCNRVRCFDDLDVRGIASRVTSHVRGASLQLA